MNFYSIKKMNCTFTSCALFHINTSIFYLKKNSQKSPFPILSSLWLFLLFYRGKDDILTFKAHIFPLEDGFNLFKGLGVE